MEYPQDYRGGSAAEGSGPSRSVTVPVEAEAWHEDRTRVRKDDRRRRPGIGRWLRIGRRRRRHTGRRRPGDGTGRRGGRGPVGRARHRGVASALRGGPAVPFHSRLLVLSDPFTALVHAGDIALRLRRALLGERQPDLEGSGIVATRI